MVVVCTWILTQGTEPTGQDRMPASSIDLQSPLPSPLTPFRASQRPFRRPAPVAASGSCRLLCLAPPRRAPTAAMASLRVPRATEVRLRANPRRSWGRQGSKAPQRLPYRRSPATPAQPTIMPLPLPPTRTQGLGLCSSTITAVARWMYMHPFRMEALKPFSAMLIEVLGRKGPLLICRATRTERLAQQIRRVFVELRPAPA